MIWLLLGITGTARRVATRSPRSANDSATSSRLSERDMAIGWPLQEARNKLSEVIDRAAKGGPQVVTRHGKRVAVIVSAREFDRLSGAGASL
ncbi:MAG: type II toxin-antitoxin system Phd/YefM family antitoxin [Betaproteobacteria bacterium]|nr:type II toxin-antitoxin system Phd/YefM family antitoxin [Betaproteobacteria bacterium]